MNGYQEYIMIRSIYLNRDYKENYVYKTAFEIYNEIAKEWACLSESTKAERIAWAGQEIERYGFVSSSNICDEIITVNDDCQFVYKDYDISFPPYRFYAKRVQSWIRARALRGMESR